MLKGISPLLTPELLKTVMEMGHDDALVLADANFTAVRIAAGKPVLRLPGSSMAEVVKAITDLLPLATDVDHPVAYMQVSGKPEDYQSGLQREVLAQVNPLLRDGQSAEGLERLRFMTARAQPSPWCSPARNSHLATSSCARVSSETIFAHDA